MPPPARGLDWAGVERSIVMWIFGCSCSGRWLARLRSQTVGDLARCTAEKQTRAAKSARSRWQLA